MEATGNKVQIFRNINSLVHSNFPLTSETEAKKKLNNFEKTSICTTNKNLQLCIQKKIIWHFAILQNWFPSQFYKSRIEFFCNSSAFVSVSLMRGIFEGTREFVLSKNRCLRAYYSNIYTVLDWQEVPRANLFLLQQ